MLDGCVLVASARVAGEGDFRTNAAGSRPDPEAEPPAEALRVAVAATGLLRLGLGGADVMERDDGSVSLCEVNFPCYFADQQQLRGVDIAGAIVDRLCELAIDRAASPPDRL